jgi:hypothetical protein
MGAHRRLKKKLEEMLRVADNVGERLGARPSAVGAA